MDDIAIKVNDVHKSFQRHANQANSIKSLLIQHGQGKKQRLDVLKGINLEIKKGEFFGIIGRNGSGKSTLLKIISQIYQPTKGSVGVDGSLTPFIELGVGFNSELTGRENVFLSGAILGLTEEEIASRYDAIVEFAELADFMDEKLKNYSSGMQVRLAFAVAVQAHNDILIVDEVLAVGDAAFQQKCFSYFERLKLEKKTVVFVSHDIESVLRFCDRAALIKDGRIAALGIPDQVIDTYINPINKQTASQKDKDNIARRGQTVQVGKAVKVKYDLASSATGRIEPDNHPEIRCQITNLLKAKQELNIEIVINKNFLQKVFWARSEWALRRRIVLQPKTTKEVIFKIQNIFPSGSYSVDIQLITTNETQLEFIENAVDFEIIRDGDNAWLWHPTLEVTEREIK